MKKLTFVFVFFVCCNCFNFGQSVSCKIFLQVAYQGNSLMNTSLNALVPNMQSYDTPPWNYPGSENINSTPVNMVDWVLVELRDPVNPEIIIARRAGILLNTGEIADTNLTLQIDFPNVPPGNYYLCIYHRNHLPVMSANPVSLPNSISYNFSDTLNFPPYGGGSQALIELDAGVYGMIAGDANKDGELKYSGPANDRGAILQYILNQTGSSSITTTVAGYREEDVNMDGIIKYSGPDNDPSSIIQNLVGLTGSTTITKVYKSKVQLGIHPFQCGDTLIDQRDGQKYKTVQIGNRCWMAENLAYLPSVDYLWYGSDTAPFYYVYGYSGIDVSAAKATSNYNTYGVLYNWPAAMASSMSSSTVPSGVQGICPAGWHLPSDEEWKILEGEVDSQYGYPDPEWNEVTGRGIDAGGNLKETGTTHWNSPNTGATNSSGFTGLAAGHRAAVGYYLWLGVYGYFWSSMEYSSSDAWLRVLNNYSAQPGRTSHSKGNGLPVRCCMDYQSGDTLLDIRDGKKYKTIQIGNQRWMAENLAYLPSVSPSDSGSWADPYYYVFDYEGTDVSAAKATSNYQTYGVLYNWHASMAGEASSDSVPSGVQGICPAGWHLPSDEEWKTLEMQLGMSQSQANATGWRGTDEGEKMKSTSGWYNSGNGTNSSGFSALPGGYRSNDGNFYGVEKYATFWSSTENGAGAWSRHLNYSHDKVRRYNYHQDYGLSVRCVKD